MLYVTKPIETGPAHEEVGAEGFPVLAITPHWRALMKRTRAAKGLHQHQLADRVGVSQNVINKIEKGLVRRSKAVIPICNALQIPPPMAVFEDELDQRWHDVGRRLRLLGSDKFEMVLAGVKAQLESLLEQAERDRNH